jgi:regulation of enolase protein 1 (concanavalin A-like superfamily)
VKKLLFILLLTIPFIGFGQGWEQTYGGTTKDNGESVQQTTDGGYIILGSKGHPNSDFWLIKTDEYGIQQWENTFGLGSYDDHGYSVKQTNDGGYILTGRTRSFGGGVNDKIWLIKTDGNGNQQWDKLFYGGVGWSWGRDVQQTTDGGYIICGYTGSPGGEDIWLIKTDSQGNSLWTKTYIGENVYNHGYSVKQTNDGGYIITGFTWTSTNQQEVWLIKTDSQGDSLWTKQFGGGGTDVGHSVVQTSDGGYIITGSTNSFENTINLNGQDIWLIRTDSQGNSLWTKNFYQIIDGCQNGTSIQQTTDGGYIVLGSITESCSSTNVDYNILLLKTNPQGDSLWTKTYGGLNQDYGGSVQQTSDGGYIITGTTNTVYNSTSPGGDVYLIKTDGNGNITSTFNIPTPSSNRKLEKVVDILGKETKPKTNTPFIEIYDDGSTEKKLIIEK